MAKMLRLSGVILTVFICMLLWLSPAALAAVGPTGPAQAITDITQLNIRVTITNNYGIADVVDITLTSGAVAGNKVYWIYLPGVTDKGAQLGSITIKNGASSGKLSVSAGKLKDYAGGIINITDGTDMYPCAYSKANVTDRDDFSGKVTLRNADNAAALLIIKQADVIPGMTVTAIVGGKIYKGTAKNNSADFQLALAKGLEEGTPVWYTVAAPGCIDIGYNNVLSLGPVAITNLPGTLNAQLFFQGNGSKTSSIMVTGISGLNPNDVVLCYRGGTLLKSVKVTAGSPFLNITALTLIPGDALSIKVQELGSKESLTGIPLTVPTDAASAPLKSADVTVRNYNGVGATFTVKNLAVGDTVKIYDLQGIPIPSGSATAIMVDSEAPTLGQAEVSGLMNLGTALAPSVYISVTRVGLSESTWFKVSVGAPTDPPPPPTPTPEPEP